MDFFRLFFSFYGRINRSTYWTIIAVDIVALIIALWLYSNDGISILGPGYIFIALMFLLIQATIWASIISIFAACTKRLHDFGQSGIWTLLLFGVFAGQALRTVGDVSEGVVDIIGSLPVLVILIVGVIPGAKKSKFASAYVQRDG